MVTLDTAVAPNREVNVRNGFLLPFRVNRRNFVDIALHAPWVYSVILRYLLGTGMPRFENFPEVLQRSLTAAPKGRSALPKNDTLTWDDLRTLRQLWKGPLIVKGILHPDDAQSAVDYGADVVIVSNHGGRNLDASIPPLFALPDIVERVGRRAEVYMDGGIMRGSDVVKALSLGAKAVLVGRAPLWGVAVAGEAGANARSTSWPKKACACWVSWAVRAWRNSAPTSCGVGHRPSNPNKYPRYQPLSWSPQ